MERTLVLIKPDGVQRQIAGRVLQRFEDAGLKIAGMKMCWINKDFAKKHYAAHIGKPFYKGLETMITEGPVIAIVFEAFNAVEIVRKLVGPTEPFSAAPGTIRGDFAHVCYDNTSKVGRVIKNIIHASGTKDEAKEEVKLWFKDDELFDYKTCSEVHTF